MKVLVRVACPLLHSPAVECCFQGGTAVGHQYALARPNSTDTIDLDDERAAIRTRIVYGRRRIEPVGGDRAIARLPETPGTALSADKLAYASGGQLYALTLADGSESLPTISASSVPRFFSAGARSSPAYAVAGMG